MTPEEVKKLVETERGAVLTMQEGTRSAYLKDQCRRALNYLGDIARNAHNPSIVASALLTYRYHRRIVDDALSKQRPSFP